MGSRVTWFAASALLAGFLLPAPALSGTAADASPAGPDSLSTDRIWADVEYLGDDALAGRAVGTLGAERAADYLAARLGDLGLEPLGDGGTPLRQIPLSAGMPLPGTRLTLSRDDRTVDFELERDILLYTKGAATLVPRPRPVIFVGYGIVAPEYDYNDYRDLDVTGAVVVFLSGEPVSDDSTFFDGAADTRHSIPRLKQLTAVARGAAGSIMIPLPRVHGSRTWDEWTRMFGFEHVTSPYTTPDNLSLLLRPDRADLLFAGSPHSTEDVLAMDAQGRMETFELAWRAEFHGAFRERDFLSANVIGLLRGRDPLLEDSYVLVSAHYDHLGVGPPVDGDAIYNGVVDNALGCAVVLEIARVMAADPEGFPRSVVFLFTTAEEKGLLGARAYCRHPAVPLHRTVAAVNVDGVAILDTFDDVVGVGAELSTLGEHLAAAAETMGLSVSPVPAPFNASEAFTMSDQYAFAEAGIPSVLVMEGTRYRTLGPVRGPAAFLEWSATRYHTPFDDLHQPLNREAVELHGRLNLALVAALARTPTPPQWRPGTPHGAARLRSLAEGR